jgi:hypothetical protein
MVMELILKNTANASLKVYVEPSTDEFLLGANDVLRISPKNNDLGSFEVHHNNNSIVIWIPHGQTADFYFNNQPIETICSRYTW